MPGLIIDGHEEQVAGLSVTPLSVVNYKDDPRLKLKPGHSMRARGTRWIRSIVAHNTKNIETVLKPGKGPSRDLGHRLISFWSLDSTKPAGAHLAVDWDGAIFCMADLVRDAAYHASSMNEYSIGIETFEDEHGVIYETQLATLMKLILWLCDRFGIQHQCPVDSQQIGRLAKGGKDCNGVFGHCNQYHVGKAHDPGQHVLEGLVKIGFKQFHFSGPPTGVLGDDKSEWASIQQKLGLDIDGVPGTETRDALQAAGFENGIYDWSRPL
jgi:hypothetical protein